VSGITTHVLDTSIGRPAAGVAVVLERRGEGESWIAVGRAETDSEGRVRSWRPAADVTDAIYRLTFDTRAYFSTRAVDTFFPTVTIVFAIVDARAHYHVPLLLSPFGYSTYRGS
jgi:5-hydroxyisourate hydrolase